MDKKIKKKEGCPIVWLKVTDYMVGWLQHELGGVGRIGEMQVLSVQHLKGVREVMRMETVDDMVLNRMKIGRAMSDTRKNCVCAGLAIDPEVMEREYGVTRGLMELFVPLECPTTCLTENGVVRPWTQHTSLSERQATMLQDILRDAFWKAVRTFSRKFAVKMKKRKYRAIEMVEAFCIATKTPDLHAENIRREWQRRAKREKEKREKMKNRPPNPLKGECANPRAPL